MHLAGFSTSMKRFRSFFGRPHICELQEAVSYLGVSGWMGDGVAGLELTVPLFKHGKRFTWDPHCLVAFIKGSKHHRRLDMCDSAVKDIAAATFPQLHQDLMKSAMTWPCKTMLAHAGPGSIAP